MIALIAAIISLFGFFIFGVIFLAGFKVVAVWVINLISDANAGRRYNENTKTYDTTASSDR